MEEQLEYLRDLSAHFESRRARAKGRLASDGSQSRLFFAVLGIELPSSELRIRDIATLRYVEESPGEIELASALVDKTLLSAVGRYSHSVRHELCLDCSAIADRQSALNLGWWLISALRIRSNADFLVPAVCNQSWSTIAAAARDSCHIQLLEDVPRARSFGERACITEEQLEWAARHLASLVMLLEIPKFRLAVDCLTTHQHEASLRMTTASLWAGIESLLGISSELRFRIAALVSAFLEPRGDTRIDLYRRVKSLYDFRSKAVHGGAVNDGDLIEHVRAVRIILSRLLTKAVDSAELPIGEEWDKILLG